MLRDSKLKYWHFYLIAAAGFGLSAMTDTAWPMLIAIVLGALLIFFNNNKDDFEFKEDVAKVFAEQGYEIIKERHLNFLERMNRDPEVNVSILSFNELSLSPRRYLRKYHRVFTVLTQDKETLDVLTEIIQHLDTSVTVEILGTKETKDP